MAGRIVAVRKGGGAQLRERKGSWTQAKRAAFFGALAETVNVAAALRVVGLSPAGAYKLKRRDPGFAEAWDQTIADAYGRVEMLLLERALMGEATVPAPSGGKSKLEKLSDAALLALLKQHQQTVRDVRIAAERASGRMLMEEENSARERLNAKLDEIDRRMKAKDADA